MRRSPDSIDEERVCIDALVQYLKELDPRSCIQAHEEPHDPPDYWLTVGDHRYAVEITSIVDDQGHPALCRSPYESIKSQIEADDSYSGTYSVDFFRRPEIPRRATNEWKSLVADAVNGLKKLAGSPPGSRSAVRSDPGGDIWVSRWSTEGRLVGMCRTPEAKWEMEAQSEISKLMEQAITKKFGKLQKKNILTLCPHVILLFYDAYGYGYTETAVQAMSNVMSYDWLHSIFWAAAFTDRANIMYPDSPGRAGCFLYSKNTDWLKQS